MAGSFPCSCFCSGWFAGFLAGNVSNDPLVRWGLIRPESDLSLQIVGVFSGYHAIRREFKRKADQLMHDQNILTGSQIRVAWTVFAKAFQLFWRRLGGAWGAKSVLVNFSKL